MSKFFPPDVSVRLSGDRKAAQSHVGDARSLLFRALNMGTSPCALSRHFDDGTSLHVLILGNQKIVNIVGPVVAVPEPTPETPFEPKFESDYRGRPLMYSGWTWQNKLVAAKMRSFYPSAACAQAYGLQSAFQDVEKLATTPVQVAEFTPGQYSGAMKRVVQAILGTGVIIDGGEQYLSGVKSEAPRQLTVKHSSVWSRTHGIYRAGPKNHWIIEISSSGGVLAMPLTLLSGSKTLSFYRYMQKIGDTDTLKVLDEFGGIPDGEGIPTGVALSNAINEGKVIRLLTPAQMEPFYANGGMSYSGHLGWAFAERRGEASNTAWRFSTGTGTIGNSQRRAPQLLGETWTLTFSLSTHNIAALKMNPPQPIGSGSATLTKVREGVTTAFLPMELYVPVEQGPQKTIYAPFGALFFLPTTWPLMDNDDGWWSRSLGRHFPPGIDISVFYHNDVLKRFKHVPMRLLSDTFVGEYREQTWSPTSFVLDELDFREVNFGLGSQGLSKYQYPHGLLPRDCREGVVLEVMTALRGGSTWTYRSAAGAYISGRGIIPMGNNGTTVEWHTVYIPEVVRAQNYNQPELGPSGFEFEMRWSARQNQYVMYDRIHMYPLKYATPTILNNLPRGSWIDVSPKNMNFVGAPD